MPGASPIVNQTNYQLFTLAYNYNRALDSHMMKNTEWGAVAYLSHSKYGMGNTNIYINNGANNTFKTGCVGNGPNTEKNNSTTCQNEWYSGVGLNGSTTGNITGIYDMSGGVREYMAAYISGVYGNSGFTSESISNYNTKYFDIYPSDSSYSLWNKRILGDATGELGPFVFNDPDYANSWYDDLGGFVTSAYPWFYRSGDMYIKSMAGLFFFGQGSGLSTSDRGFRLVLAP